MKAATCIFLVKIFDLSYAGTAADKHKSINLALETVLEFGNKDNSADVQLLDNVEHFVKRVKNVISTDKNSRRELETTNVDKLTDFIQISINILNTYEDNDLEDFFDVLDKELRNFRYRGCKFRELTDNMSFNKFMITNLDSIRGEEAAVLRRQMNALSRMLKEEDYNDKVKELVDYINSLYKTASAHIFDKFLINMNNYKNKKFRNKLDLDDFIQHGVRSVIFDYYSSLDLRNRLEVKGKLDNCWKSYMGNDKQKYKIQDDDVNNKQKLRLRYITLKYNQNNDSLPESDEKSDVSEDNKIKLNKINKYKTAKATRKTFDAFADSENSSEELYTYKSNLPFITRPGIKTKPNSNKENSQTEIKRNKIHAFWETANDNEDHQDSDSSESKNYDSRQETDYLRKPTRRYFKKTAVAINRYTDRADTSRFSPYVNKKYTKNVFNNDKFVKYTPDNKNNRINYAKRFNVVSNRNKYQKNFKGHTGPSIKYVQENRQSQEDAMKSDDENTQGKIKEELNRYKKTTGDNYKASINRNKSLKKHYTMMEMDGYNERKNMHTNNMRPFDFEARRQTTRTEFITSKGISENFSKYNQNQSHRRYNKGHENNAESKCVKVIKHIDKIQKELNNVKSIISQKSEELMPTADDENPIHRSETIYKYNKMNYKESDEETENEIDNSKDDTKRNEISEDKDNNSAFSPVNSQENKVDSRESTSDDGNIENEIQSDLNKDKTPNYRIQQEETYRFRAREDKLSTKDIIAIQTIENVTKSLDDIDKENYDYELPLRLDKAPRIDKQSNNISGMTRKHYEGVGETFKDSNTVVTETFPTTVNIAYDITGITSKLAETTSTVKPPTNFITALSLDNNTKVSIADRESKDNPLLEKDYDFYNHSLLVTNGTTLPSHEIPKPISMTNKTEDSNKNNHINLNETKLNVKSLLDKTEENDDRSIAMNDMIAQKLLNNETRNILKSKTPPGFIPMPEDLNSVGDYRDGIPHDMVL